VTLDAPVFTVMSEEQPSQPDTVNPHAPPDLGIAGAADRRVSPAGGEPASQSRAPPRPGPGDAATAATQSCNDAE